MAEALWVSCRLRFTSDVDDVTARAFVDEVMDLVELEPIKGSLVGVPGLTGLSVEQRKRLTIAVELVANPSIVFMDVRPCLPPPPPPRPPPVCCIVRPSQGVQVMGPRVNALQEPTSGLDARAAAIVMR